MKQGYDLIVIGGGINGAAISRDAALRGLDVLLLEARDFASGASGNNGRMIHGGLRYLKNGDLGLVFEALRERHTLLRIAPHLVRKSTLLIPAMRASRHPAWQVGLGLLALDILALGTASRHTRLGADDVLKRVPALRADRLSGGFVMHDAFADNAERLTIENVLAAAESGADIRNYARVTNLSPAQNGGIEVNWQEEDGDRHATGRHVINATGAWTDEFLSGAMGDHNDLVTKAQGSFIVAKATEKTPREAVFIESQRDGRPVIVTPWLGNVLIGTTDRQIDGPADSATTGDADIDYLLDAVEQAFEPGTVERSDILYTYCGVRPLPAAGGSSHKITRKHVIHRHSLPYGDLLSVFGGKLSTFRSLADDVTRKVFELRGQKAPKSMTAHKPLPGAVRSGKSNTVAPKGFSSLTRERLDSLYGVRAADVLDTACAEEGLSAVVDPESGAIAAEFVFAVRREFARTLSDVFVRRTLLSHRPDRGESLIDAFCDVARTHLGWAETKIRNDVAEYRSVVAAQALTGARLCLDDGMGEAG